MRHARISCFKIAIIFQPTGKIAAIIIARFRMNVRHNSCHFSSLQDDRRQILRGMPMIQNTFLIYERDDL